MRKENNEIYFETLSLSEVCEMHEKEAVSTKCLDRIKDKIGNLPTEKFDLVDLGTFVGLIIGDDIFHFNKYMI